MNHDILPRRSFLGMTGSLVVGFALPFIPHHSFAAEKKESENQEAEVNPVEDLMREHGVLRRILLIYEEALRQIEGGKEIPSGVIEDSAGIIRRFIEDYHEKLEEDELFPRFEKAGKLVDLVKVLYFQHQAGRRLTDRILESAKTEKLTSSNDKAQFSSSVKEFINMYRPHAAREDTVLFPAFRTIVPPKEFDELGDRFEDKEQELFGKEGFEKMVGKVAEIEKKLGIYDLSQFTPKA